MERLPKIPQQKVIPLPGHKCLGAKMVFEARCECGWYSCPNEDRAHSYSEWRRHARDHGAQMEDIEVARKRTAREAARLAERLRTTKATAQ